MIAFLKNLAASDVAVDLVGCVNDGVRLTTEGSDAIPHLRILEDRGATVASCGTCLDHLELQNKLSIGIVGTMEQTVQIMATADKIIRV
jgi:hypothetical protein